MLSIVPNQNEVTMSSLDFLNNLINPAREAAGQSPVRTNEFIRKITDELDLSDTDFLYQKIGSNQAKYINLNYDQMMLVGMRESKAVRKSVLTKLKELQQPQQDPALVLAHKVIEQAARIEHLEKTKAQINDKRTATLMNKASQDAKKIKKLEDQLQDVGSYLSITGAKLPQRVDTQMKDNVQSWRLLKQLSADMQLTQKRVRDERYGEVLAYHVDVIARFKSLYL